MPWRARVSASPADGRPAANRRCTESSARMVCGGVSGMESRTPHGPSPSTCSGSSWLVPHTCGERGARDHQHPPGSGRRGMVCAQPVGGLLPVLGKRTERAGRGDPAGPRQRGADHQRGQGYHRHRYSLVPLGVRERAQPRRPRRAAWQRNSAQQLRQAQHQGQPDHRPHLVYVAQGVPAASGTPAPGGRPAKPARRGGRRPAAPPRPTASSPAGRAPASPG